MIVGPTSKTQLTMSIGRSTAQVNKSQIPKHTMKNADPLFRCLSFFLKTITTQLLPMIPKKDVSVRIVMLRYNLKDLPSKGTLLVALWVVLLVMFLEIIIRSSPCFNSLANDSVVDSCR